MGATETKKELNQLLKEGDSQIAFIRKQQANLIANYVKQEYQIELGDILSLKGTSIVVTGFDTSGAAFTIYIRYKRFKYNGNVDNINFKTPLERKLEKLGKFNGKF